MLSVSELVCQAKETFGFFFYTSIQSYRVSLGVSVTNPFDQPQHRLARPKLTREEQREDGINQLAAQVRKEAHPTRGPNNRMQLAFRLFLRLFAF